MLSTVVFLSKKVADPLQKKTPSGLSFQGHFVVRRYLKTYVTLAIFYSGYFDIKKQYLDKIRYR